MLIAGELNLEVPDVSRDELTSFLQETETMHTNIPGMSREEVVYGYRNSRPYPWTRRILEVKGKSFYNYQTRKPFVDLMPVINQLPIIPETRVVLLLYQFEQPLYDFTWHFDRDDEYGFRLCIGLDTSKPFLEFGKMKEEFKDFAKEHTEKSVILEPGMVEEDKVYSIIPTKTNSIICINGHRYCHRVPIVKASDRISIIVRGKLTTTEFDLIQKVEDELHS